VVMVLRMLVNVEVFQHVESIFESDVLMVVVASMMVESLVKVADMAMRMAMMMGNMIEELTSLVTVQMAMAIFVMMVEVLAKLANRSTFWSHSFF